MLGTVTSTGAGLRSARLTRPGLFGAVGAPDDEISTPLHLRLCCSDDGEECPIVFGHGANVQAVGELDKFRMQ